MAGCKRVLVVLDFDWSLVEENSDTWVLQRLGASEIFKQLIAEGRPWTQSMDEALLRAHTELGAGQDSVLKAIHSTPFHQDMARALQHLAAIPGCHILIISDANTVFISEILKHHNLAKHVHQVYSNAAVWQDGALRVRPFHNEDSAHGCQQCPPNLCKGQVLDGILADTPYDQVAYLGDGSGDFCPCTRLQSSDYIAARECYPTGTECPLFRKIRLAGATIANCFESPSSLEEAVSRASARPEQAGDKGRPMKAISEWTSGGRESRGEQESEVPAAVCPWRIPSEAAALLIAIVTDTAQCLDTSFMTAID